MTKSWAFKHEDTSLYLYAPRLCLGLKGEVQTKHLLIFKFIIKIRYTPVSVRIYSSFVCILPTTLFHCLLIVIQWDLILAQIYL